MATSTTTLRYPGYMNNDMIGLVSRLLSVLWTPIPEDHVSLICLRSHL